jgi:PAS domain S-box-containing protein
MNETIRILIVEDNQNDVELVKREIKQVIKSCEFANVETQSDFLRSLSDFKPDIIISDYSMPDFDGLSVIRLARQNARLVPVIICTGSLNEETAAETVKAGAVDYVVKEHIVRLSQAVLQALEKKQMWQERILTQEKLRVSEERYRLISAVASDYMFSTAINPDGSLDHYWIAGAFEKITGYTVEEYKALGGWRAILHPDDKEIDDKAFEKLQTNQQVKLEVRTIKKDGEIVWVRVYTQPVWDENKNYLVGIYGAVQDISERKKAEEETNQLNQNLNKLVKERTRELEISNKTKDKFFSIISHDLKNPFTGILLLTEILIKYLPKYDVAELQKQIQNIRSAAERGYKLLENLLSWAMTQTGNINIIPKNLKLKNVVDECIGIVSAQANLKNIKIDNNVSDDVKLRSDEDLLKDIIRNLLTNAVKFTPDSGLVTVEAEIQNNVITVSVTDSGLGMSKETINNLFRIDRKMPSKLGTAKETGSGLGLILCSEFVEKLGGAIRAESKEGKGSTFKFTVPVSIDR